MIAAPNVPPLAEGERLSADEFRRRYWDVPETFWAELVDGVVYLDRNDGRYKAGHARLMLVGWLGHYQIFTPGLESAARVSHRLDPTTEVQPVAFLDLPASLGGRSFWDDERCLADAPALVAETCPDANDLTLNGKLRAYERAGVRELIVWRTLDHEIDWFDLRQGAFIRRSPDPHGLIRSRVFPGLWLDPAKLLGDDGAGLLATMQAGHACPEHAAFVAKLAGAGA